ncbi:class I SAM-dependent methyltransferase [Bradyrhizobium hipponense]|uniref:Class I SAM-dependent methyltransferase n=1 Tax=Bradyrhizobium hipponense TaxID=2605638 RepID=A0A5S4Y9J4_9BRAD|nr:class I SAM-dependent methyltransferase [Bradyrhizobium hipponense]TYO61100.1 class I SAM-dependent methyltransferase [Bradyrhizobium hipponense]
MSCYFHHERHEIRPLLPKSARNILEIGAASGQTLRWIRTIYPHAVTTGVEINGAVAAELSRNVDVAIIGDIDECLPRLKKYDLILMLDILEHLIDSSSVLQKVRGLLEPGGRVVVSVPNVAHLSVTIPLLFRRQFDYQDAGILDRTHLRFFVEDTAIGLMNAARLNVSKGLISGMQGYKAKTLNGLSLGLLRHHLAKQYIMLGEPVEGEIRQPPVKWMIAK